MEEEELPPFAAQVQVLYRITIPPTHRKALNIKPGDIVIVTVRKAKIATAKPPEFLKQKGGEENE